MYTTTGTAGFDLVPAASAKVMITFIAGSSTNCQLNGGMTTSSLYPIIGAGLGTSATTKFAEWFGNHNMKLFINSTESVHFNTASGSHQFSYSGIEI
jgi:hypothetical protein